MSDFGAHLKLWTPDNPELPIAGGAWTADHTVDQIFAGYYLPTRLADAAPETVRAYREAVNWWTKLTGGPGVGRISEATMATFETLLRQQRGKKAGSKMRRATVEKHKRHLQPVFDVLGRKDRSNHYGLGLLHWTPYFAPSQRRRAKKTKRSQAKPPFLPPELVALFDACRVAHKPRLYGIAPPQWWRSLFCVIYNSTWRIGQTFELRYSWIKDGWVTTPAGVVKLGDEDEGDMRWPFNVHAQTAVDLLRTPAGRSSGQSGQPARDLVFCYRDGDAPKIRPKSWDGCCRRTLDDIFKAIKKAAGIDPEDGRMFHAIRRAAALAYERQGRGVGSYMCGHTGQAITDQAYVGDGLVEEYAAALAQPAWSIAPPT